MPSLCLKTERRKREGKETDEAGREETDTKSSWRVLFSYKASKCEMCRGVNIYGDIPERGNQTKFDLMKL
jgi:hypothetical protein